ncbi:nitroreductase family protein [Acetobacterium bakii]|uniref:nitroreductase family protein n=1 Tax=Acetobacterium bakii TaxID=52689 RepID=UPI000681693D|nr:nitroreductase family protein [Acetobacterium bakii]
MEFQEVIESRRSVRKYDPTKEINEAMIKEIINAAILAPSWKNSQSARYYVIRSNETLAKFKQECLPPFNANNSADAPVLLITAFAKNLSGWV